MKGKGGGVVGEPQGVAAIVVATHSNHVASRIEVKAKCLGLSAIVVEPRTEAILGCIGESQSCVVVVDALQERAEALAITKVLSESRPNAKTVLLGNNVDLQLVARAIVRGASCFLLESTPSDEFAKALSDLLEGKQPDEKTLFGRVYCSLPSPVGREGWFRTFSGRRLSAEDAVKQCDQFGLSVDEIADYLQVAIADAERITHKSRKVIKPSLISLIRDSLMPAGGAGMPSRRSLFLVLASLVVIRIGVMVATNRQPGVPTTQIRGRIVSGLSAAELRGLHICFWPLSAGGSQTNEVRPSAVRVWSEDGRFAGKVISDRRQSGSGSSEGYAVTILNGECDPFPEKVLPAVYGDPTKTPLRVKNLGEEIVITVPRA